MTRVGPGVLLAALACACASAPPPAQPASGWHHMRCDDAGELAIVRIDDLRVRALS